MRPHVLAAAAPGQGANRRLALEKAQRARRRLAHPAALAGQGSQPLTGVIKLRTVPDLYFHTRHLRWLREWGVLWLTSLFFTQHGWPNTTVIARA
jgi:hypothetical protein